MSEIVYINGSLAPASEAKISPLEYGYLYGFGLFETFRVYNGKIFKLEAHLSRLTRGMKTLGMPSLSVDLKRAVTDTLNANKLTDARVRITVSAGEGNAAGEPASCKNPTVLITAREYRPPEKGVYEKGFKAIISSIRSNSESPLANLKTTCRLGNLLAKEEAKKKGADDAVFLNEHDLVAEATTSNIFIFSEGVLLTPAVQTGILPGVTREVVMKLALKIGIDTREQDIWLDNLLEAEEAFLTNSLFEVMPLVRVVKYPIGDGKPGMVTQKIMAAYSDLVKKG